MADKNAPQIAPAAPVTIPSRISLPREWPFRLAGNLFLLGVIFMLASVIIPKEKIKLFLKHAEEKK